MDEETRYLPLSGLQHMIFCDRQAALIHVEGLWVENHLTIEGEHLHRVVDEGGSVRRDGVRVHRGLRVTSSRLKLSGRADVVEFHVRSETDIRGGIDLDGDGRRWQAFPVEYKRGEPKAHRADEVQLCAQAMCLEEQFGINIPEGALFYGEIRRRTSVRFDEGLRNLTAATAALFHEMVFSGSTPVRSRDKKCDRCSLLDVCLPRRKRGPRSAADYTRQMIQVELETEA